MNKFKKIFLESILIHPKRYLLISLFLFGATVPGILTIKQDFSYRIWYSEEDPLLKQFDLFERKFGNDDNLIIGLYHKDGLYNPESIRLINEITEKVWKIDSIQRVDSLTNFDYISIDEDDINVNPLVNSDKIDTLTQKDINKLQEKIKKHKFIEGTYISKDGKLAVIAAQIQPSFVEMADNELITKKARLIAKEYSKNGYQLQVIGTAVLTHIFKEITEEDLSLIIPCLYIIFSLILWLIYKNKFGIIFPYIIILVSIVMMLGLSSYLGLKINTLSSVAPNILLTVALADCIHILTVFFFTLRQGKSKLEAITYSLDKNFYPTLLTSITTAIGFFSFANAKIEPISGMGISVGFGVLFAWILTYFLLGPLIILFVKNDKESESKKINKFEEKEIITQESTKRFIKFVNKFKYHISGLTIVLSILFLGVASKYLQVNLDPYSQFPSDYKFIKDIKKIEDHLGPSDNIDFMIHTNRENGAKDPLFLHKVESFQNWLESQDYISSTFSIIDIIKDINKSLNKDNEAFYKIPDDKETIAQELFFYTMGLPPGRDLNNKISLKSDSIRLQANWSIHSSKLANLKMEEMRNEAKRLGLNLVITGKTPLFHDLTPYVVTSFVDSFKLAFLFITIVLIIVLRSFKLGFLALIPNLFPLIVGTYFYILAGWDIDMASVIIASVCLGIAVDDSIHFLFEYQKFRKKGIEPLRTLEMVFTNTIPSLVNTTIIIVIGFASFYFATYVPNSNFGVMVALILSVALLADILILPALLLIAEKWSKDV